MLVVTANWAFNDGTLGATAPGAHAVHAWPRSVGRAVVRAGFGRDGRYRPPDGLDVVLAGDTFDPLVSAEWCGRERPWRGGTRTAEARRRALLGCARRAGRLLAALAGWARRGLPAPAADRRGRPVAGTAVRVPVRIVLLPGDRDRHLFEMAAAVAARGATVAPAWSDETVFVAHGHELDPTRHVADPAAADERPPSLAESVVVDLVVPFAVALERRGISRAASGPLVAALAAAEVLDLPEVVAAWAAGTAPGAALDAATRRDVRAAWTRAVDGWLRAASREPPDCGLPGSPLEQLAAWFTAPAPGRHPRVLAPLRDGRRPAARGGTAWVVLGHPTTGTGADARTICLGRPPMRPWLPVAVVRGPSATDVACVAAVPPAEPATLQWRRDGGRPEWHRPAADVPSASAAMACPVAVVDAA